MIQLTPNPSVCLLPRRHRLRGAAEDCAARIYQDCYGARLDLFPDVMATLPFAETLAGGGVGAVAGIRLGPGGFFSESYLAGAVESRLADISGTSPSRERIVEYTTLAAARAGAGARLIRALVTASLAWGCDWSVFTATEELRLLLTFQAVPFHVLAVADPARIAGSDRWGTYYAHNPLVCAVWRGDLVGSAETAAPVNLAPVGAAAALHA